MSGQHRKVAWVLGGGGLMGATEVGMARALAAHSIQPDLIVGTSIGALNGAVLASAPIVDSVRRLAQMWSEMHASAIFGDSLMKRVRSVWNHWTHLHSNDPLRKLVDKWVPYDSLEEAYVDVQACAACIETSSEHWFSTGPVVEAVLASCALPGVLPPVEIGGRHYIDGGVVNSIPISRALDLGAEEIYVLHVGHIDDPLTAPRQPWDVAMISFEIARRHRFNHAIENISDDVKVHVLPTGRQPGRYNDFSKLRYGHDEAIQSHIEAAETATSEYMAAQA